MRLAVLDFYVALRPQVRPPGRGIRCPARCCKLVPYRIQPAPQGIHVIAADHIYRSQPTCAITHRAELHCCHPCALRSSGRPQRPMHARRSRRDEGERTSYVLQLTTSEGQHSSDSTSSSDHTAE
jgi:hypothetical protein